MRTRSKLSTRLATAARESRRTEALNQRMRQVVAAVNPAAEASAADADLPALVETLLERDDASLTWLVTATLTGDLPTRADVQTVQRTVEFDGAAAGLRRVLDAAAPDGSLMRGTWAPVEILTDVVLVDMHHTARTELATGIQRVARQSAQRWQKDHDITVVGWTTNFRRMRRLSAPEVSTALHGTTVTERPAGTDVSIIPWRATYVMPELMTERERALRLQALVDFAQCRSGVIGFDCVPLTSAETIGDAMGAAFSVNLTAVARMNRVATISQAAATEYRGWRTMLAGAGLAGPEIEPISLAVEATAPSEQAVARVRERMIIGSVPMVLVVGSHEPRKNHLAVLHAAELLWREGHRFSLTFIGGNAWNSDRFVERLNELRGVGRPVESIKALSDEELWAAYRLARFSVFPSTNEGFGLPVAESLASGVPVVTSGYGSMAEIVEGGGALLIDPRDDHSLTDAMRTLLTDDALHAELTSQALKRVDKSWDTYAAEVWDYLVAQPLAARSRPGGTGTGTAEPAGVSNA